MTVGTVVRAMTQSNVHIPLPLGIDGLSFLLLTLWKGITEINKYEDIHFSAEVSYRQRRRAIAVPSPSSFFNRHS